MIGTQHLLAMEMSLLLTGIPSGARPEALGIIVVAERASLRGNLVSEGTSVYGGDRFSTEAQGALQLRSGGVTMVLDETSIAVVQGDVSDGQTGFAAELVAGSMTLSIAAEAGAEIQTLGAKIRPSDKVRAVVQVRILNPKELLVSSRRGSVQVTYPGETEVILEGKSYYVLLNSADNDGSKEPDTKSPEKHRKVLVLIAVASAAAAGIWIPLALRQNYVSPDRP